jgi:para-nitrobenzyl esterase
VTPANYQADIARALGVTGARAAAIAAGYPPGTDPALTFSLLVSDASFACPALQVDRWTAARGVPAHGYQFNDDNAPINIVPPQVQALLPHLPTHGTDVQYLLGLPNAPFPATPDPGQQALAASMRTAWASFAARGDPSTRALPWPPAGNRTRVLSFVPLHSKVTTGFAAAHHCSFWATG